MPQIQSPCARLFQKPKLKTLEFGVSFIDQESANQEYGRTNPQICLNKVWSLGLTSREEEMRWGVFIKLKLQAGFC